MGSSFSITTLMLLLLVQGAGSLFLALLLGTLFAYRRQPTLLFWALAWLCNGLFLLAYSLSHHAGTMDPAPFRWGGGPWLTQFAILAGWCNAAFWMLSLEPFLREVRGTRPLTAGVLLLRSILVLPPILLLAPRLSAMQQNAAIEFALALVLVVATLIGGLHWHHTRRVPGLLLTAALGINALDNFHLASYHLWTTETGLTQHYTLYAALADLASETLLAVATLLFLIDAEQFRLRRTVAQLEESEQCFRLLFEYSGVGMTLLSRDGRILQANPALLHMLGYPEEELRGRRLVEFVHASDATKDTLNAPAPGDTPSFYEREKRYVRKDGESIWARVLRVPIRDAAGETQHYVGVLIDITQRRRAEEQLAQSEQRYRLLNQVARDGIHVTDETGRFLEANPAFCSMLGYESDALLAMRLTDVADEAAALGLHLESVLKRGGDRIETRLRRRNGTVIDVEMSGALLDLEGKKLLHGICRDISENKRVQEKLQEERDFGRQVLEAADVLIFVVDPLGRIVHFNGTCRTVLGYREEEVRGRFFWDVLLPERNGLLVRDAHHQLIETPGEAPLAHEMHWRTREGQERLVTWRNAVVNDAQGQVRYVISTGQDVTEQRQLEDQLRQARKLESLGTLVGGIAHDFNNQLTVVLGNLTMALGDVGALDGGLAGTLQLPLAQAEQAAQRCAEITQRLLTFSSGKVGTASRLALNEALDETVQHLRQELPPGIELKVHQEPGLWPIVGNASQLQQVLLNLSANAREAMPKGGTLTLTLVNRVVQPRDCLLNLEARPGRFVELTVADTGGGMTAEVLGHLFEPFFTTKEPGQAAGMGLALVYGIVKAHKGWISVQSEPGQGSTFRIYLPVVGSVATTRPAEGPVERGSECILVVDDEDLIRSLVETILQRSGYDVLTASDGDEALDVYRANRERIALVLLDYSMPKMNGLEVLREMLKIDPRVCVVFSSGFTRDSDSSHLLTSGARDLVPKPYHPDALLRVIRRVLDQDRISSVSSPDARG